MFENGKKSICMKNALKVLKNDDGVSFICSSIGLQPRIDLRDWSSSNKVTSDWFGCIACKLAMTMPNCTYLGRFHGTWCFGTVVIVK